VKLNSEHNPNLLGSGIMHKVNSLFFYQHFIDTSSGGAYIYMYKTHTLRLIRCHASECLGVMDSGDSLAEVTLRVASGIKQLTDQG